jgi:TRAP-type transport system periplasmic protein
MNRILLMLCIGIAPFVYGSSVASAAPTQIVLGHASKQAVFDDTTSVAAEVFRQEVARLSDQRLRVEIASDGMLGGNRDMASLVEKGVIQTAMVTLGGVSTAQRVFLTLCF